MDGETVDSAASRIKMVSEITIWKLFWEKVIASSYN